MKKISALLAVLVVSAAFAAACSKSSETSTSTAEASAAATTAAMATTAETKSMATLPIPLSKLKSMPVAAGSASAGAKVFAAQCASCHGTGGKGGTVGPTLAGTGVKAGQVAFMVRNPQAIDKDSAMPKLPLSNKELADVAAYVASLKK